MARINLLPWREELRLQKNKEFITLVVMIALLAGLAVGATLLFYSNKLSDQKAANELITTENQKLDKALKEIETLEERKEEIISRMKVIQDLQGKRPIPVRVWDDLARAVPDMLFLTKLERKNNQLILSGKAENPNIVSTLINNLDRGQWMGNSSVQFIEKGADAKIPDRNSTEEIYPENSYVGFQVTTTIQMEDEKAKQEGSAEGAEGGVPASTEGTEMQEGQQLSDVDTANAGDTATPTSTEETEVQAGAQETDASASTEKTANKSEEPTKESDEKAPAKQDDADKSQENADKDKATGDDTSNASKDNTAEKSSDDTAKDSGGDT